jgi:hypothetical protein
MVPFAAALVSVTLILGIVAGPLLERGHWAVRQPGLALAGWIASLTGMVAASTGALTLVLLWPPAPLHEFLERLHACLPDHAHAGLVWATILSALVAATCCHRLSVGLPRVWRAVFHRRRHREMLRLVARQDERHPDVLVLDHPIPVAYCLPSRQRSIVVSSGARNRLEAGHLAAVLAHERAHLRNRHHLLLLWLDLTHSLLPWLPTVRRAQASVPQLLEMIADDAAVRRHGRELLAEALKRLVPTAGPAGTLAAAGSREDLIGRRLERLGASGTSTPRGFTAFGWVSAACASAAPMLMVAVALAAVPLPC